jgi:hypothetical protein
MGAVKTEEVQVPARTPFARLLENDQCTELVKKLCEKSPELKAAALSPR